MTLYKKLAIIATTLIPAASFAYKEIDYSRVKRITLSQKEHENLASKNYDSYFSNKCKNQIVFDISGISDDVLYNQSLKRALKEKGHKVMTESLDTSYPLRTTYFRVGQTDLLEKIGAKKRAQEVTTATYNIEKLVDLLKQKLNNNSQLTMSDLESVLLSDLEIENRVFVLSATISAHLKQTSVPDDLLKIDQENSLEFIRINGDGIGREATFINDDLINGEAHHVQFKVIRGLELKKMQREALELVLKQTSGRSVSTHMGDLTPMLLAEALERPFETENSFKEMISNVILSLPDCK